MKNRLLYLVILLITQCFFCSSNNLTHETRFEKCRNESKLSFVNLYWFESGNKFQQRKISLLSDEKVAPPSVQLMVSTCICRKTYEPIFFVSPYYDDRKLEDIYVYCVPGNLSSHGIYDEYEAYDKLLFQYTKTIPKSLMSPFVDENKDEEISKCLDKNGFPTKSIANQATCMLVINTKTSEIYSGSLTVFFLKNYQYSNLSPHCYTSLNDSTDFLEDKCLYVQETSTFFCCCAKEPSKCNMKYISEMKQQQHKSLFCASNTMLAKQEGHFNLNQVSMNLQEYYDNYVDVACGVKISASVDGYSIDYYSSNISCSSDTGIYVNVESTGLCSTAAIAIDYKTFIGKCCQNGHFCNINLIPNRPNNRHINYCAYKPQISYYFDIPGTCELYFNPATRERAYLHKYITAEIVYRKAELSIIQTEADENYYCGYIYAKIINFDSQSSECKDVKDSIRPFYYCSCKTSYCDHESNEKVIFEKAEMKEFLCENLSNFVNEPKFENSKDKWFCYVQITIPDHTKIIAGHLRTDHPKFKECLDKDIIDDSKFCCVNVMDKKQTGTECTVEKQIARYTKKNPKSRDFSSVSRNLNETDSSDSDHIHCYSKDIFGIESKHCPKTDGCFSTRSLQASENLTDNNNAIDPAGCVGLAEEYTVENLSLTSFSLGCRSKENSNKCSIVQTPDGQQRIVCCCTDIQNDLCLTNLHKVPPKIGRTISSFKN